MKLAIIIPARLASTRLPQKVLKPINGKPLIYWTIKSALDARIGDVVLAGCSQEVCDAVDLDVEKIITNPDLPNGTMRVYEASKNLSKKYDYIINMQGDLPFVEPEIFHKLVEAIKLYPDSIITPIYKITSVEQFNTPSIVKVALGENNRGMYFSRSYIPYGAKECYKHIGIYLYPTNILEQYMSLPVTAIEGEENLEQLRALYYGIPIFCPEVNSFPLSVDTKEDLEEVIKLYG